MKQIVYGQPNLYFLFMAMSAKLIKEDGELIFIVPHSFSSGLYFSAFRKWFAKNMQFERVHLFVSRNSVFEKENILQETIILKAKKVKRFLENIDNRKF
jgi:adenine-specific DNA-methyltransferase